MKRFVCVLILAGFALMQPAFALPGDATRTVVAQIKRKPFKLTSNISELGGARIYQAYASYRGKKLGFFFQNYTGGVSEDEIINYDGAGLHFTDRSDPRVREILTLVYSPRIAADYLAAKKVAQAGIFHSKDKMTFYRGSLYAYNTSGSQLILFRLANLAEAIANAKRCATEECGGD